jgi:hypothetical protein
MLIEEIDGLDAQPFERRVGHLFDVLGPAIQVHGAFAGPDLTAELRGDDDLALERLERFADELLVRERAVDLGRIEERDAALHGRADELDALLPVRGRAVAEREPHAAEPERRDFEITELA